MSEAKSTLEGPVLRSIVAQERRTQWIKRVARHAFDIGRNRPIGSNDRGCTSRLGTYLRKAVKVFTIAEIQGRLDGTLLLAFCPMEIEIVGYDTHLVGIFIPTAVHTYRERVKHGTQEKGISRKASIPVR